MQFNYLAVNLEKGLSRNITYYGKSYRLISLRVSERKTKGLDIVTQIYVFFSFYFSLITAIRTA